MLVMQPPLLVVGAGGKGMGGHHGPPDGDRLS